MYHFDIPNIELQIHYDNLNTILLYYPLNDFWEKVVSFAAVQLRSRMFCLIVIVTAVQAQKIIEMVHYAIVDPICSSRSLPIGIDLGRG